MAESTLSASYSHWRRRLGLSRRRIYILPTVPGVLFGITLIVMLLGAINYDNSLAYGLTFLIGSLMPVTILHTYRNIAGLNLTSAPPQPVFAGDHIHYPIVFDNRGQPARHAIDVRQLERQHQWRHGNRPAQQLTLAGDSLHTLELPVLAEHRGLQSLRHVRVASSFPLGLFRCWSNFSCHQTAVVYPKPAGHLTLPAPLNYQGDDTVGVMSGSEDFIGFRNYHPGDSIRSIDWKAFARGQELLIKRFSGSGSRQIDINWEYTRSLGDTETRLSQMSLWVVDADRLGLRYRLRLPGIETPLDHGPQHRHACLLALAQFGH